MEEFIIIMREENKNYEEDNISQLYVQVPKLIKRELVE